MTFGGLGVGRYALRADAPDGGTAEAEVVVEADGARARVELTLVRHDTLLVGRVLAADGQPFRGTVAVARFTQVFDLVDAPVETPVPLDADGGFRVAGLAPGAVVLVAREGPERRFTSASVRIPSGEPFVFRVGAGATHRDVHVVEDDGERPVAGATVFVVASSEAGSTTLARTTTDAVGRCRMDVPADRGSFRVVASGFVPQRVVTSEAPTDGRPLVVRLRRGARLVGRVTSAADGRPVPGLAVRWLGWLQESMWFPVEPTTTDADGRYAFDDLDSGRGVVLAEGDGWCTVGVAARNPLEALRRNITVTAGETTTCDLTVTPSTTMRGTVRDAAGAPVASATVRAVGRQARGNYDSSGAIENSTVEPTVSAEDGTFLLRNVVPDAFYVSTATAPDGRLGRSEQVLARADGAASVVVRVEVARRVVVRVVDAVTGGPVPDAWVTWARKPSAHDGLDHLQHRTDADGVAAFEVRIAGPSRVMAWAHGYLHDPFGEDRGVDLAAGGTEATVRLRRGSVIVGQVVDAEGAAVASADVEVRESQAVDESILGVRSDEEGRFTLTFPTPEPRVLFAERRDARGRLEAVATAQPGGAPVTLRLAPATAGTTLPGARLLHVVGPDGREIAAANVELDAWNPQPGDVESGWATVRIGARATRVLVSQPRSADGRPLPLAPAILGPIAAGPEVIEVRLVAGQSLAATVVGPDDAPVPGVTVYATWAEPEGRLRASVDSARTGPDGTFRFDGLAARAHTVHVDPPDGLRRPAPQRLEPGTTGAVFRLESAVAATVTVLDADGRPVDGASVEASDPSSHLDTVDAATTGASGRARLGRLRADQPYELAVEPPEASGLARAQLGGWRPTDTTVRLRAAQRTRGRVRGPDGAEVRDVQVGIVVDERCFDEQRVEDDGTFEIDDRGDGELRLRARVEGLDTAWGPEVVARAGATDVELVADPGVTIRISLGASARGRRVVWFDPDPKAPRTSVTTRVDLNGVASVRVREADRPYGVWCPPEADDRSLLALDVRRAERTPTYALARGAAIRGRVQRPAGATDVILRVSRLDGRVQIDADVGEDGAFEFFGLPEGVWRVQADAVGGGRTRTTSADVATGGTVELRFD